jgi:hypothetical protein
VFIQTVRGLNNVSDFNAGMAMRLAFHLALHMDMTAYVERGILKPEEAEIRRTAFWGAYIADQSVY